MENFIILVISSFMLITSITYPSPSYAITTRRFHFNIEWKKVTRLCHTKQLLTVNGQFPGPMVAVREGDTVEIKVTNRISHNTTIHWHGLRQYRTGWADGPAYITQCPIRPDRSYTYRFVVEDQRGTLLWHAHHSWQRASVYGAFVIYPRRPYPFPYPVRSEIPILLGEWWKRDVDDVEKEMMKSGAGPMVSDAYTINGLPGPLYPCSSKDTFTREVEAGKTYVLRIVNAALNNELFFAVSNHTLIVVEVDAVYTKPFQTGSIMIAPGQTTIVLLRTLHFSGDSFPIAVAPYVTSVFPFNNSTALGFLRYKGKPSSLVPSRAAEVRVPSSLPGMLDTEFVTRFSDSVRSLATEEYPCRVPSEIDKRVITMISLNLQDCPANRTCEGYAGKRFFASMNNISFVRPPVSILESYYKNRTKEVFDLDFPDKPRKRFDYTGVNPLSENMNTEFGTKLFEVEFGARLEIVFQGTSFLNTENHPIHVHGHNFFVVGSGFGNFDRKKDPERYNLVDPPERNTVAVPTGGWTAIRINADNPGVWFIHCHLEEHTSWGLAMGFIVKDGSLPSQKLLPPPRDLPQC
ncbi:PREDICTED: laccase-1 [Tarenaya hassleriana]|uniref:laccase-1 n=1 Tax=Tarenaya hassleriana TaxID=28532 RepID=UPI00053C1C34|nr:PREDICTED: laccase-1 [Tarenaya hassleriana]